MQLHGWKEIATYLGRSVRAAQRWEQELALPVRRKKTAAGQTVYAEAAELDAWRTRHDIVRGQPDDLGPDDRLPSRRPLRWIAAAAVVVAAASAGSWWMLHATAAPPPAQYRLAGNAIEALDAAGRVAWQRPFAFTVAAYPHSTRAHLLNQIVTADIDGDGRNEVLVMTPVQDGPRQQSDRLTCFDSDGRQRWQFDAGTIVLSFRAGTYRAPWRIQDIATSPPGGQARIWIAIAQPAAWPSAVIEIDRHGLATTRFVQSGPVYALHTWPTRQGLRLVAGGVNTEFAAASVAVLDPDRVATSPQTDGSAFQCLGCPADTPSAYYVLPPDGARPANGRAANRVAGFGISDGGRMLVRTADEGASGAPATYALNPDGS